MYLDGEGKIKLITYVPYLTMYLSREVTTDFQISNYSDLIRPTAEIYYDFLTHIPGRGGQGESYYYMLQYVFLDNPTDFVKYASLLTDDEQDHLLMYFFYFDSGYNRESEIHALCEELIKEKSLTAEEKDLITELWLGSI